MPHDNRFRSVNRLRRPADFERVYRRRCSVADDEMIVYGWPNQQEAGRLGLSVAKKFGHAPRRNRWKRLVREAYRHNARSAIGIDVIVIPRRGAQGGFTEIQRSLPKLLVRLQRKLQRQ